MTTTTVPTAPANNVKFFLLWAAGFPAVLGLLALIGNAAGWTGGEVALVTALAQALSGLVLAVVAHYWPTTTEEPVAIQTALTATVLALFNVGNAFGWWQLDESTVTVINGLLGFVFAVPALKVRSGVYAQRGVTVATEAARLHGLSASTRKLTDGSDLPGAPS